MIVEDDSLVVVVECAKRALIYCLYASHDLPSEVDLMGMEVRVQVGIGGS